MNFDVMMMGDEGREGLDIGQVVQVMFCTSDGFVSRACILRFLARRGSTTILDVDVDVYVDIIV